MPTPGSARSQINRRESLGGLEADPWGSPQLHRGHNHAAGGVDTRSSNHFGSVRSTTNAWSSHANEETGQSSVPQHGHTNGQAAAAPPSSSGSGWGNPTHAVPSHSDESSFGGTDRAALGVFGPPIEEPSSIAPRRRSLGLGRSTTNPQVEETVTVALLPEKEGLFMFQHRNYEVKSARRGSTVIRRYSDFVWLLDCLQKRFPFRQLPLLPPKRVSGM